MRRLTTAVLAAPILILAACGQNTLDGEVTGKDVRPGYTYVYMQPTYTTTCSGSPSVCRTYQSGTIPIIYSVPTCYEISVEGQTDDATGSTCLDKSEWEGIEIGETYVGPGVDPKDRQEKVR